MRTEGRRPKGKSRVIEIKGGVREGDMVPANTNVDTSGRAQNWHVSTATLEQLSNCMQCMNIVCLPS